MDTIDFQVNFEPVKIKKLWEQYLCHTVTDYNKSFVSYGGKSIKYMELISMIAKEWKLNIRDIPFGIENTVSDHYRFIFLNVRVKPLEFIITISTKFEL